MEGLKAIYFLYFILFMILFVSFYSVQFYFIATRALLVLDAGTSNPPLPATIFSFLKITITVFYFLFYLIGQGENETGERGEREKD